MFDESKIYRPTDPELRKIAMPQTLAHWRCRSQGPRFIRLGNRIGYEGKSLNQWLASRTVETRDA